MLVLQGSNPGSTVEIPESQPIHGIGHIFGWEFMDEKNKRRTFSEVCEVMEVLWPFFFFHLQCVFLFLKGRYGGKTAGFSRKLGHPNCLEDSSSEFPAKGSLISRGIRSPKWPKHSG